MLNRRLFCIAWAALLGCVLTISGCGGGSSSAKATSPTLPTPPPSGGTGSIPAGFFAVNDTIGGGPPQLNYGTLAHPVALAWQTIEQQNGVFDFSIFDNFVVNIAPKDSSGTALMVMTLGKTPPWATSQSATCQLDEAGNTIGCTAPPDNIQDWTNFITQLMNHYNGSNAPHVKYYEIWNEADNLVSWSGTPAQMEQLAAAAYPIIKQDTHSLVLGPSVTGNIHGSLPHDPTVWLNSYLSAGGTAYQDITSFHGFVYSLSQVPYPLPTEDCLGTDPNCGGSIVAQVAAYQSVLTQNGVSGRPLFNTEGGFEGANIPDLDTKAAWLAQYYVLQAGMYDSSQVQLVSWFTWGAPDGSLETGGVLTPVGIAYDQVYDWLVGRTLSSPCSNNGSVWTCTMTGSGGYQAEIIWDSSQTCAAGICTASNQTASSTYLEYKDLAGNSFAITNQTVPVGLKPILLDNQSAGGT